MTMTRLRAAPASEATTRVRYFGFGSGFEHDEHSVARPVVVPGAENDSSTSDFAAAPDGAHSFAVTAAAAGVATAAEVAAVATAADVVIANGKGVAGLRHVRRNFAWKESQGHARGDHCWSRRLTHEDSASGCPFLRATSRATAAPAVLPLLLWEHYCCCSSSLELLHLLRPAL